MKKRKGFVSNSSSTSFVIAIKEADKCPHCGRHDIDFIELIKSKQDDYCDNTKICYESAEEILEERIIYGYDNEMTKNLKAQLEEAVSNGMKVAEIRVSNCDNTTKKLMDDLEVRGDLIILEEDER